MQFLLGFGNETRLKKEMPMDFFLLLQHAETILRLSPRHTNKCSLQEKFSITSRDFFDSSLRSSHFSTTFSSNAFHNSVSCSLEVALGCPGLDKVLAMDFTNSAT